MILNKSPNTATPLHASTLASTIIGAAHDSTINIVLFDGECGFCHKGVHYFIRLDSKRVLHYMPIASSGGVKLLKHFQLSHTGQETIIFFQNIPAALAVPPASQPSLAKAAMQQVTYQLRSDALIAILGKFSLPWRILARFLAIIPRKWRDQAYDTIARRRRHLPYFKNVCRYFSPTEKQYFLEDISLPTTHRH